MSRIDTRMREEDWKAIYGDMVRGGYTQRWARERYRDIYGQEKFYTIGNRLILPDTATKEDKEELYEQWLEICKLKGHKPGRAANQYKELFGVWPQGFVSKVKQRVGYGVDVDLQLQMPRYGNNLLSQSDINNSIWDGKDYKKTDGGGMFLLVKASGRYWRMKYRFDGKERLHAIGVYPKVGIDQARKIRDEVKSQLTQGIDPATLKRAIKEYRRSA
jgi:hypothetical protein